MVKFIICMLIGGFVGVTWMCLCSVVDDIDELADLASEQAEATEEPEDDEPDEWCDACVMPEGLYDDLIDSGQ